MKRFLRCISVAGRTHIVSQTVTGAATGFIARVVTPARGLGLCFSLCLSLCLLVASVSGQALAAENGVNGFTLDTPPAQVLESVPSLAQLSPLVGGGWGKTWQEASILVNDAPGSEMLVTRYIVATQNMLISLRASLEDYSTKNHSDPEVPADFERVGREFYWGAQGQALECVYYNVYTVPRSRIEEAHELAENPRLTTEEKRARLTTMSKVYKEAYWFDISAPFRHNCQLIWR